MTPPEGQKFRINASWYPDENYEPDWVELTREEYFSEWDGDEETLQEMIKHGAALPLSEDAKTEGETQEIEYYHFTGSAGMKRHPDGIWVRRSALSAARVKVAEAQPWMWFFRDQMTFGEIAKRTGKSLYDFTRPFTKACRVIINGDKDAELTTLRQAEQGGGHG